MRSSRNTTLGAVCLLMTLVAFLLRATSLDVQSLWRDEVDALRFATAPWSEILSSFTRPGWNGPMYFFILRGWVSVTGTTGYAMRFFSLVFGVLCVPLSYVLGTRLFRRYVGTMTALLVTFSPYLIWYSQEVKMYTFVPALVLLALYALRRAVLGHGRYWWVLVVIATSVGFYSHILAALLIPVEVMWGLLWWPDTRRRWSGALISLLCLAGPYLPLLIWQIPLAFKTRETGFYRYTLDEMVKILLNGWSLGILVKGAPWGTAFAVGLAFTGLVVPSEGMWRRSRSRSLRRRRDVSRRSVHWRERVALLVWLIAPVILVAVISIRQPLFTDRYLIWSAPAFYLLVALGSASLRMLGRWGHWIARALTVLIITINIVNIWSQATVPIKADFRAAASHVLNARLSESLDSPGLPLPDIGSLEHRLYLPLASTLGGVDRIPGLVIFQIPYGRYAFDYYVSGVEYVWADGLYTNSRLPDGSYSTTMEDINGKMIQVTAGYSEVWLIATEMELWDERGLVKGWLEANGYLVESVHFTRVDVYRYAMELP